MRKTIKVRRSSGRDGSSVLIIEHICGDYANFSVLQLIMLAGALLKIAGDAMNGNLRFNQTKEYEI